MAAAIEPDYYAMLWKTLDGNDDLTIKSVRERSTEISYERLLEPEWEVSCRGVSLIEVFVFARHMVAPALRSRFIKFFLDHQALPEDKRPLYLHPGDVHNAFFMS